MKAKKLVSYYSLVDTFKSMQLKGENVADKKLPLTPVDLSRESERKLVTEFFNAMNLPLNKQFACAWADKYGLFTTRQVFAPFFGFIEETQDLVLKVGFEILPVVIGDDGSLTINGHYFDVSKENGSGMFADKVFLNLTWFTPEYLTLVEEDKADDLDSDEYGLTFPIYLDQDVKKSVVEQLYKAMVDGKTSTLKRLLPQCVSKIEKTVSRVVSFNKLLLPMFKIGKFTNPVRLNFSGWTNKTATKKDGGTFSTIYVSVDVQPLLDMFGDYPVVNSFGDEIMLSDVNCITIDPGHSRAVSFQKDPQPGYIDIFAPAETITHTPIFDVTMLTHLTLVGATNTQRIKGSTVPSTATLESSPQELPGTDDSEESTEDAFEEPTAADIL